MTSGSAPTTQDDRPLDSIATGEFAAARSRLAAFTLDDDRRALPLRYVLPAPDGGPVPGAPTGDPAPASVTADGPIGRALAGLGEGTTSCTALLDEALAAVAERDAALHAVVARRDDPAREESEALDAELAAGGPVRPLHGIPITVKDVIDVAGVPTRCGSLAYHRVPDRDAAAVARLRAAGAVVLAKVSTHEFALGVTSPQSRNPHDPDRIPGGSSGGSAIAVATGMGLGSLGTDTRASIRVPAALSGVVGFKATAGRVPTEGVVTLSWTMDHTAPMATTVGDVARVLAVLLDDASVLPVAADVDADLARLRPGGLRLGVPTAAFAGAQPAVVEAVEHVVAGLAHRGHRRVDVAVPSAADFDDANAVGLVISRTEAASFHRGLATDLDRCWVEIAEQLRAAGELPAVDYLRAQRARAVLADRLAAQLVDHDLLVMPTAPVIAPPADDYAAYLMVLARNAIPWSLVGLPAVSIPCGRSPEGLPIGVQLVAAPHQEALLVAAGRVVEAVARDRWTPVT